MRQSSYRVRADVADKGPRVVRPGGIVRINKAFWQHNKLLPFVGQKVYVWGYWEGVEVWTCEWEMGHAFSSNRKCYPGKLIVQTEKSIIMSDTEPIKKGDKK